MKTVLVLIILLSLGQITGCASQRQAEQSEGAEYSEYSEDDSGEQKDSLESFNRVVFAFNIRLDRWFLKPIAKGYDFVMPSFAQRGVRNFFGNLGEINNVVNDILQWKWGQAANDSGRFITNTTLGLGGLFDVAGKIGMPESDGEDFGQTFAKWGVGQGPYVMLPFLGPSSLRGIGSLPFDSYLDPVNHINDDGWLIGLNVLDLVDSRAQLLETEDLASGDLYVFIREFYLKRREYLIKDGEIEADSFGDEDF